MVRGVLANGRTGFYLAVTREGEVDGQDEFIPPSHDPDAVSISEVTCLYVTKEYDIEDVRRLRKALTLNALPESWNLYFQEKRHRLGV
jgi:MOSC domain-containing protein YiiM